MMAYICEDWVTKQYEKGKVNCLFIEKHVPVYRRTGENVECYPGYLSYNNSTGS